MRCLAGLALALLALGATLALAPAPAPTLTLPGRPELLPLGGTEEGPGYSTGPDVSVRRLVLGDPRLPRSRALPRDCHELQGPGHCPRWQDSSWSTVGLSLAPWVLTPPAAMDLCLTHPFVPKSCSAYCLPFNKGREFRCWGPDSS